MATLVHRLSRLRLRSALRSVSQHPVSTVAVENVRRKRVLLGWQALCGKHQHIHSGGAGAGRSLPSAAPLRLPFSHVNEHDLAFFRQLLADRAITDPEMLESSNVDWLRSVRGELTTVGVHKAILCLLSLQDAVSCCYISVTGHFVLLSPVISALP